MPDQYENLVVALKETGIPFAEYEWKTRPSGDYGTVALEFEADALYGDDQKQMRSFEGSVDLFMQLRDMMKVAAVESALAAVCESCWSLNSIQYENDSGLVHYEWAFQVEG